MAEEEYSPMLNVRVCSHGKKTGIKYLPAGSEFTVPGCGRGHTATTDKYEVDEGWLEEERQLKVLQDRAAKARAARFGNDPS
jgi:uncharacterized protein YraI